MLRSLKSLLHFTAKSKENLPVGKVERFFLDGNRWTVQSVLIRSGPFLKRKRAVLPAQAIQGENWQEGVLNLTPDQPFINSIMIAAPRSVRQRLADELSYYFQWPNYGAGTGIWGDTDAAASPRETAEVIPLSFRSDVLGFDVHATDGKFGRVTDLIVDDHNWIVRYFVIHIRAGKSVLISSEWVTEIDHRHHRLAVNLSHQAMKKSPRFDATTPVNRDYENKLYDYYGRPKYWEPRELKEHSHDALMRPTRRFS